MLSTRSQLETADLVVPNAGFPTDRLRRASEGWPLLVGLCVGLLLALGVNDACAHALGSLGTSVGLFAALAALFVIKGWPAHLQASALSTAGGALVIAGGAAWLWRARAAGRAIGFAGLPRMRRGGREWVSQRPARAVHVRLPTGIDRETLLVELRLNFVRLQEAWDAGSMPALQGLTTPEMLAELCLGLPACTGGMPGRTDVVTLQADLFGFEQVGDALLASVEFSGLMREAPSECAAPFRELWMLTKSELGASGWKLARHQGLL